MQLRLLTLLAACAPFVLADVKFTTPRAGASIPVGTLAIAWAEGSAEPPLSDLTTYSLFLCAGGNEEGTYHDVLAIVPNGNFQQGGNAAQGTITAGLGGSDKNAYFLRITSTSATGGSVTNFSPRFTLTGMTGGFDAPTKQAIAGLSGTNGPDTQNNVGAAAAGNTAGATGEFAIPFNEQTGLTRYAPMMAVPPTKITMKTKDPLFPKSSVKLATTFLPTATILTTVTAAQTYTPVMKENTVAPVAQPTDDMQKFLNRWKD
ncbi:hypothetical protein K402DRAFT_392712 [Aulographum hederae CBS 113979]|uniref:Uncharacterized protein n=1 Tax=Aulographum hederae CBS 113979 TaxID=1176131 RepID=A0A6G1H358_9PEZI|nr:hypothetical protein K402DRAFT_392712 [Aulographum hederae CBS 113979]